MEWLPAPAPTPGPSPTWYFRGFPCRAKAGLHRARYHGTCGQHRALSPRSCPRQGQLCPRLGSAGSEEYFLPVETPRPPGPPIPPTPPMPAPGGIGKRSVPGELPPLGCSWPEWTQKRDKLRMALGG